MKRWRGVAFALAMVWSAPAAAGVENWSAEIETASIRFGIPSAWVRRVMAVETGGNTRLRGRPVVSRAGAMGLMQLMPGTWADMRLVNGLGPDPYDPHDNIVAGVAYLRAMYDRFGYPGLFAAYNAGPERYARYLAGRARLPRETADYLARIARTDIDASALLVEAPQLRFTAAGLPSSRAILFAIDRGGSR